MKALNPTTMGRALCLLGLTLACRTAFAQLPSGPAAQPATAAGQAADGQTPDQSTTTVTMFPHPDGQRWWISGHANIVFQAHPGFHSPYEGVNSLLARGEYKTSLVGTLFLAYQLVKDPRWELDAVYNEESAGGRGVSEALGLAGFTNLDVVRNPQLGPTPYLARVQLHQTIGLTDKLVDAQRSTFSLATKVPARRIDLRVGKMSLPDFFDANGPGSDSHLQFLNWTVDNNGAYDYAADTRGYTYSAVAEYDDGEWALRYGMALMPTIANGIDLDWNLRRARGDNYEIDWNKGPFSRWLGDDKQGAVRVTGYVNHANMGLYRNANREALQERGTGFTGATPVITAHTPGTTVKYGIGLNFEQAVWKDARVFGRFGWNEGQHESYAYTEVDQTFEVGGDLKGSSWGRQSDKIGLVCVSNAIKRDHQQYLALGGLGFLLGDGRLNYGREDILEGYYNAHNWRGLFTTFDLQTIAHPGYNQDRGPVVVFTVRSHVDF